MRHLPIVAAIIASLTIAALATVILTNYKVWQWLAVTVKRAGYNNWQGLLILNLILMVILVIHSAPLLQALLISAMFATAAAVVKLVLWQVSELL